MAIQKTTNFNLNKADKYERNWDIPLNQNADIVDTQLKTLHDKDALQDTQILNLIANPIDEVATNLEVVDARLGADNTPRASVGTLIREIHSDTVKAKYSEAVEVTQSVISLPSTATTGQVSVSGIKGNTYTNLLGNIGDCEDSNSFVPIKSSVALDNNIKVFGGNSIIASATDSTGGFGLRIKNSEFTFDPTKYYLLSAYIRKIDATDVQLRVIRADGNLLGVTGSLASTSTTFVRQGVILQPTDFGGLVDNTPYIRGTSAGLGTKIAIDGIMVNEISSSEYNLGLNELLKKYSYINSTKSTVSMRLASVNEQLWNGEFLTNTLLRGDTGFEGDFNAISNTRTTKKIRCKPNNQYTVSGGNRNIWRFEDLNGNKVGYSLNANATSPSNAYYMYVYYSNDGTHTQVMINEGSTVKPYIQHKNTKIYVPSVGGSVGSSKDEVSLNPSTGQYEHKKKNNVKILQVADILDYSTIETNVDVVLINKPLDYIDYNNTFGASANVLFSPYRQIFSTGANYNNTDNIGGFTGNTNPTRFRLIVAKGTFTSLADAQSKLTGIELNYQLLVPEIKQLEGIGKLKAYPNGTIFIEPVVRITAAYNHVIVTDLPIKAIESVTKLDGEKRIPIDLTKVTFTAVGNSSQVQIQGALNEDVYEIVYEYPSELTTLPSINYSYPLNMAGELKSIGDMTFSTDKEFKDYRAYNNAKLWYIEMRLVRLEL